jgi:hypothetical protein
MAPPAGGWTQDGKLRIQSDESLSNSSWTAKVNGITLSSTSDVSEPYPNPYSPLLGLPEDHRAWVVPKNILNDGINQIQIKREINSNFNNYAIVFIDIAIQ